MMEKRKFHVVGKKTLRKDGIARVTGQEKYTSDISLPHMLHSRVLRSPYPHARIKRIDTKAAEQAGAVCITLADIPKVRYNERIVTVPDELRKDRFIFPDKIRHMGEAIAAVAAESEAAAEKALQLIKVEYEILDAIFDPIEAMKPGAPQLYDTILKGTTEIPIKNNIAYTYSYEEGDIEKGFAQADVVVEGEYRTAAIYHLQLETKCAVCQPEPDGGIVLWATSQSIHNVRILLGEIFGLPLNKVNVKYIPIGGTFGSSIQMNSIVPICVALALKARRPVKLVTSREEDAYDHRRYPTIINLKLGAMRDGRLVAGKMRLISGIGAHNTQAHAFIPVSAGWWVSLYRLPSLRYDGIAVYTNNVPSCAMQGFGNPQVGFAVESSMDELAEKLGIDPVELRLKNYVGLGQVFWGQGPTVRSVIKSDGVPELLRRGAEIIGWNNRPRPEEQKGRFRRGIGMGRGFHTTGAAGPQPSQVIDYTSAFVKINEDGSVDVVTAVMDHGGGTREAIAKIVAEELCVPLDKVGVSPVDTRTTTYDCVTHATRGVYTGGGGALKVAKQVKKKLLDYAARILDVTQPEALSIRPDPSLGQGVIYAEGIPGKEITVGEVAKIAHIRNWGTFAAVDSLRHVNCPPCFIANFIDLEVDTETGKVRVLRAATGSDAGTVINPDLAAGQLEGGLVKGISIVLYEDARVDEETGALFSQGYLTDLKAATSCEMPPVGETVTFFANTEEPSGPFGAKGIGEAAVNAVPAAMANAIRNALGIRFYELPITKEKILEAIAREKQERQDSRKEKKKSKSH
jgi:xanthine dehydrogenase molybdenum-binding subunit